MLSLPKQNIYYRLNVCDSPNSYIKYIFLMCWYFTMGPLGGDEVIRALNEIEVLIKESKARYLAPAMS